MTAALGAALSTEEVLYFSMDRLPSVRELATSCGDPHGQRVYFSAADVRLKWLDEALAPYRKR